MKQELNIPEANDGVVMRIFGGPGTGCIPIHRHTELEMNLVVSGTGRYIVQESVYELRPDTMLWLFPGQEHQLFEYSMDFEMWVAVFKPRLIRRLRQAENQVLRESAPPGRFIRSILRPQVEGLTRLFHEADEQREDVDRVNAALHYLLVRSWIRFDNADPGPVEVALHPAIARILHRLARRDEGESVEELAGEAGLSRSHFLRLFREQTGVTVTDYRNRLRLERFALHYDGGRAMNMTEAALDAGFGSYAQFLRVYKAFYGASPRNDPTLRMNRMSQS